MSKPSVREGLDAHTTVYCRHCKITAEAEEAAADATAKRDFHRPDM